MLLQARKQPSRGATRFQANPLDREPGVGDEAGDNLGIGSFVSRTILPLPSRMQSALSLVETSMPM
jgi:hypothetical protein